MKEKSIRNDLQETFHGEDDEEDVLQTFLKKKKKHPQRNSFCFKGVVFPAKLLNVHFKSGARHQVAVGVVAVFLGHGQVHRQSHAVGKDGQEDDDFKRPVGGGFHRKSYAPESRLTVDHGGGDNVGIILQKPARGYFHSTMVRQALRKGFLKVKKSRERAGLGLPPVAISFFSFSFCFLFSVSSSMM